MEPTTRTLQYGLEIKIGRSTCADELPVAPSYWITSALLIPAFGHSDANLCLFGPIVPLDVAVKERADFA